MRTSYLIHNNGTYVAGTRQLINLTSSSPSTGAASSTQYACQISLEFFNNIITDTSGYTIPDITSTVYTGVTGTLGLAIYSSQYAPYPAVITGGSVLDLSSACTFQWTGVVDHIILTATSIVGCNFIRICLDRNNSGS